MVVADSAARCKVVDFKQTFARDYLCPYCPKHVNQLGTHKPWEEGPHPRPAPPTMQTAARLDSTVLKKLKNFNIVLSSPPDPMHAVHGGMCQRFWFDFLVDGCGNIGKDLEAAQTIISKAKIPTSIKRPDNRMGDRGAGPPSAEQWVTFFRCQLPFIMLHIWAPTLAYDGRASGVREQHFRFEPKTGSSKEDRPLLEGMKHVSDIFPVAMLLCCIVELMEQDLDDDGVEELRQYIKSFNIKLKDLCGQGWLTFNQHIAEHIPDAIKRFGATRNFSCLPFERYNGKLGRINNSGHKQGKMRGP